MATLKSIELSGWKSIKHAKVDLGPINVLIGANGSGKSNFISFFKLLNEIIEGRLQEYVATAGGANSILHYGAKTTPALDFRLVVSAESELLEYKVRLADSPRDSVVFGEEQIRRVTEAEMSGSVHPSELDTVLPIPGPQTPGPITPATTPPVSGTEVTPAPPGPITWTVSPLTPGVFWYFTRNIESVLKSRSEYPKIFGPEIGFIVELLRSCRPYHINDTSPTALIRRTGYIEDNRVLRSDAANLAAVLHRIRILTPRIYERIVRIIRQINPRFGDFVLEPQALNPNQIMLNWKEKGQDTLFGPHQLSDGTLRVMALVTLLLQPEAELPALLVIDEPELGLHPYAIGVITSLLRGASYHSQVIISTQSTQLLNEFDVGEVIVVNRPGEETTFSRLDEAQLAGWLEDYNLAELWQKNVLGGGPH
jgi:predicted ATPase